jgi:hypothetical protein
MSLLIIDIIIGKALSPARSIFVDVLGLKLNQTSILPYILDDSCLLIQLKRIA